MTERISRLSLSAIHLASYQPLDTGVFASKKPVRVVACNTKMDADGMAERLTDDAARVTCGACMDIIALRQPSRFAP